MSEILPSSSRERFLVAIPLVSASLLLSVQRIDAAAQTSKPRAQVRQELVEAIRAGDVPANGESGLKPNELHPRRYPMAQGTTGETREELKVELADAIQTGDVFASDEIALKLNEISPQSYPVVLGEFAGKTREQVKTELAQAIRTGDILAGGESGLKLNEVSPRRYSLARASGPSSSSRQDD